MENSQDKVAGEGFGADDGATGVVSLPVPGYTPLVSGSSPPVMSEGGVTPFFLFSFFLPLFFLSFFFFHPVILIVGSFYAIILFWLMWQCGIGGHKLDHLRHDRIEDKLLEASQICGQLKSTANLFIMPACFM
jgi:hypothetical protein